MQRLQFAAAVLCSFCLAASLSAQEGAGQGEIGLQHYSLTIGSQRVTNVSGLAFQFAQFLPDIGIVSASFTPALSDNRFRTGDDYLRLKGLPWLGQYWTFNAGDFRLLNQTVPFTNIYYPEIAGRGGWVEARHGDRTVGFFYGEETISNSPRVPVRLQVPQKVLGGYFRQQIGNRFVVRARLTHFVNDLAALQKFPYLLTQSSNLKKATTASLDTTYTLAGPLKFYSEATWSTSERVASFATRQDPVSFLVGPILETKLFTLRANYVFQSASYLPLLGYYLGDKEGPFGEAKFRPFERLEIYGSASKYQNNIARDPTLQTLRSTSESAGASLRLPARLSFNAQLTLLDLSTRATDPSLSGTSHNKQITATLSRPFRRHNLRFTARDFQQVSRNFQRQRSGEIEDIVVIKRLVLGAGLRGQREIREQGRTSLFYRGSAQFHTGPFSAYANVEIGNDLVNKTLFATDTVSTTLFGASLSLGKNWEFSGEAYRNNLVTELNTQSIFVLQGQGVFIPGALSALNQWSVYFRVSRKFYWGQLAAGGDLNQYATVKNPLKGSLEGFVMTKLLEGTRPAEGVSVTLDEGRTVTTDAQGRYHFAEVPEGAHKVALALLELPTDFDPGDTTGSTVVVRPNKLSRADMSVVRLSSIQGKVAGPPDTPVDSIVIRMEPGQHYTTPDSEGNFYFYNVREGNYELALDQNTLPEYAVMKKAGHVPVSIHVGRQPEPVSFEFEIHKPEKPVRKVLQNN